MAKGKYKVRAANVLAHTESELLRTKTMEVEKLKSEVSLLTSELKAARADSGSRAMHLAAKIADSDIAAATSKTDQVTAEFDAYRTHTAIAIWELYSEFGCSIGQGRSIVDFTQKYAQLFGVGPDVVAELVQISSGHYRTNRKRRRMSKELPMVESRIAELKNNPSLKSQMRKKNRRPDVEEA